MKNTEGLQINKRSKSTVCKSRSIFSMRISMLSKYLRGQNKGTAEAEYGKHTLSEAHVSVKFHTKSTTQNNN
jgi:hypothetical protein